MNQSTIFNKFFNDNSDEEPVEKTYDIPSTIDAKKFSILLKKQQNMHLLIPDICSEVIKFLNDHDIFPQKLQTKEPMHILKLDNVVIFVVDNYLTFNAKTLPKKYVENTHFEWIKKGFRSIWVKKFEWEDLRKRKVLQSLILHACGKTKNRIFARNTYTEVIPSKNLKNFFNESSFYGYRNASFAACLKDKKTDEILMAVSFGFPFYGKNKYGKNSVECIRAASKPFTIIVGGMSKLMKYVIETFGDKFDNIVYYVDDAHYNSKSMDSIGFKYSHFAGGASHNVWVKTGAMFMRTPNLHKEIMHMIKENEIVAVPDVGNSTFIFKLEDEISITNSTDT